MVGRWHRRFWSGTALGALGLAVAGCSGYVDELPRQAVPGTVTLDGRPMASGVIVFLPSGERKSSTATSGSVLIKNGRFSLPRARGLVPATYRIAIYSGMKAKQRPNPEMSPGQAEAQTEDLVPAKYNTATELEVEIKPGGIKELRLEIDSK